MNKSMDCGDNFDAAGAYLRQQREQRKIGLREMARRLHLSPSYLYDIEAGHRHPRDEILLDYAREVGANGDEVLLRAGRVPGDVIEILQSKPELLKVLRSAV